MKKVITTFPAMALGMFISFFMGTGVYHIVLADQAASLTNVQNNAQPAAVQDTQSAATQVTQNAQVDTSNAGVTVKVAPGELLPVSIKLLNFGGGKKVDVSITYSIINSRGDEIYSTSDTVAVETTASFVKTIQIPFGTPPGNYRAKASITYQDQVVPATTEFPFIVENKIIGLFQSDFYLYGGITALVSICMVFLGSFIVRRQKASRLTPFDYSTVPYEQRIYFEMVSDTIMQMRLRVGDTALEIASHIDGLQIDQKTGKVLNISENPSKIIATLVSRYDKVLGEKVNFSFRPPAPPSANQPPSKT